MLKSAWDAFTGLPEAVKTGGPVAVLLFAALIAGARGDWVFGSTYQAMIAERDEFKGIAFHCTGVVTNSAEQSAEINDTAVTQGKPTIATVKVVAPLTRSEKRAIEPPRSAEATELRQKIDASEKVLQKTEVVAGPSPTPTKKQ